MFAHGGNKVDDTGPIARDPEEPMEHGVRGVELVVKCLEMSVMSGTGFLREFTR